MLKVVVLMAMLCGLTGLAMAQTTPVSLTPTPLEAFANRPTARVSWSTQVWRAQSLDAHVVISAIVVEDSTAQVQRMRGIRIDLTKQGASDQVFLDESKLEVTRKAVNEITNGLGRFLRERDETPHRCRGAEEFWRPGQNIHTLNVSYCITPRWSGLVMSAYKDCQGFGFPGRSPAELSAALTRAIEELKRR